MRPRRRGTPLTTFRMYTEMLADGTIRDPGQRQEYLEVLSDESRRLSGLVESVLAYSGLEEQSAPRTVERLTLGELLERVEPPLRRLTRDTGHELEVDCAAPPASSPSSLPLTAAPASRSVCRPSPVDGTAELPQEFLFPRYKAVAAGLLSDC